MSRLRQTLTPHQRDVLAKATRYLASGHFDYVTGQPAAARYRIKDVGSRSALAHLADKGYLQRDEQISKRGAIHYLYCLPGIDKSTPHGA